jgi:rhodanese-related sulfurtransferase
MGVLAVLLCACGASQASYQQISQDEAMQMMEDESGYIIVDVRRPDEFNEGHIPGAINIPNEEITDKMPPALPDKDQMLLIYCRRGNRSKEAAQKLADMGYTNVYEFGGIETWTGDVVTEEQEADVAVTYDIQLKIGDTPVSVTWEKNDAVDALAKMTAGDWHEYQLSMYGGFEQVGSLGSSLPASDKQTTTEAGDIVLYSGDQIVVFYGSNSWAYTKLGHIDGMSQAELEALLGNGDVTISLKAEYSE